MHSASPATAAPAVGPASQRPDERHGGGQRQAQTVALNRQDPSALDAALAGLKPELESAVAGHSSL